MASDGAGSAVDDTAFSARSVMASLLLGLRRPQLPGRVLVRTGVLFGLREGATRVALSRMVSAGELVADGGVYRLAGPLLERHGRQEAGRHPALRPWDGTWRVVVVGSGGVARAPAERAQVRRRLEDLRLAEWREGVWVRPDNLTAAPAPAPGCSVLVGARFAADAEGPQLAARLWATPQWAATAGQLRESMAGLAPASDLGASFRLAGAVVRHLRDDPLLPEELLPPGWPGAALRVDYDAYEAEFNRVLRGRLAALSD